MDSIKYLTVNNRLTDTQGTLFRHESHSQIIGDAISQSHKLHVAAGNKETEESSELGFYNYRKLSLTSQLHDFLTHESCSELRIV